MQLCTAFCEKKIQRLFYALGFTIGRRPWHFIVGMLSLIALLSVGMVRFDQISNVADEFTPTDALSRREFAVVEQFLQRNGSLQVAMLIVQAKHGGSLLDLPQSEEVLRLCEELSSDLKVVKGNRSYGFDDMCEPYCDKNAPFTMLFKVRRSKMGRLTYPVMDYYGMRVFVGNNIFGVKLKKKSRWIDSFSTAVLYFYFVTNKEDADIVNKWENAARKLIDSGKYRHLSAGLISDNLIAAEIKRTGDETAPLLAGSITFLVIFVVSASFRYERKRSKPWEALIGAVIPLFAITSSVGLLSACGLKFQSIVVAALFLVLAVGVDHVFMLLRAWDLSKMHTTVENRMAYTLMEAGPSISITTLTDALSSAVGIASSTPSIQTFCIYSTVSISLCYLFQLVLFSSVLALSGRREEGGRQAVLCWRKADPKAVCSLMRSLKVAQAKTISCWSYLLTCFSVKAVLGLIMIAYWSAAYLGMKAMKTDLSVQKLAVPGSYMAKYMDAYEKAIADMQSLSIFVQRPGNLTDPWQLRRVRMMVQQFERTTFSFGSESTFLWLSAYEEYVSFYGIHSFTYTEVPAFLKSDANAFWRASLRTNDTACLANHPDCIEAFMLTTGFHTIVKYEEMIPLLKQWRGIAAGYSDMNVTVFNERAMLTDVTEALISNVYTGVPAALGFMTLICIIFIPNLMSIICAMLSVLSINFGVFGCMSLWGIDLDPLSLAALLMSIGLSVDYTAHISYHYYKRTDMKPAERIELTLKAVGWPTLLGGVAMALSMWPLLLKSTFIVFLKTVVLVVIIGLFHGLIVLPAILTCLPSSNCVPPKPKLQQKNQISSQNAARDVPFHICIYTT
uniref:SSD domain-containing protein n=1 Tax=Plectus sambesii TaxID=2011161 RepID=A0A914XH91_9BILA